MSEGGWLKRKRKRPVERSSKGDTIDETALPPSLSVNAAPSAIPASLMPHLGWTKISACHRPRSKRKRNNNWNRDEPVQKVTGRAVFFVHDPRPDDGESDRDESKIWFQGRFFPSASLTSNSTKSRNSPTSVSSETILAPTSTNVNSWGLLAVQNQIIDDCLTCSEGGYRELDLTFIRSQKTFGTTSSKRKEKKVRYTASDVVWTGGNMMTLTSDPYTSTLPTNEPGVKFEPRKLMQGHGAMEVANKYFPSMVKRLRIHNVTNDDLGEEESGRSNDDAMVIIGDMEVVAPVSFVRMGAFRGGDFSDDDGLWND